MVDRRSGAAVLAALLVCSALATGCVTVPSPLQIAESVARYQACPATGVLFPPFPRPGDYVGEIWPESDAWVPPVPFTDAVLLATETWTPQASARSEHIALRRRHHTPMPTGAPRVLVLEQGGHDGFYKISRVVTRSRNGEWRSDELTEFHAFLDDPSPQVIRRQWTLSPERAVRLERLLNDPCISAEPPVTPPGPWLGTNYRNWLVEVEGTAHPVRARGVAFGWGRTGAIVRLVTAQTSDELP